MFIVYIIKGVRKKVIVQLIHSNIYFFKLIGVVANYVTDIR